LSAHQLYYVLKYLLNGLTPVNNTAKMLAITSTDKICINPSQMDFNKTNMLVGTKTEGRKMVITPNAGNHRLIKKIFNTLACRPVVIDWCNRLI